MQRFVPPSSLTLEAVVPELIAWHDRFIDMAHKANGLHLSRLKAKLTYLDHGMPSLSLGQWLRYLAAHERRHLWQIERIVLGAAAFPPRAANAMIFLVRDVIDCNGAPVLHEQNRGSS